ncbi:hypothetical protein AMJ40_07400, partial [candidate division TA06 bacterium DG_26]
MNVLVIKDAGLGDTLIASSFLREVRAHLPIDTLDFVGDPKATQVLPTSVLDRVHLFDRGEVAALPLVRRIRAELRFLRRLRCGFRTYGFEEFLYNVKVEKSTELYESENYLAFLRRMGKTGLDPLPFFSPGSDAIRDAKRIFLDCPCADQIVGLNPGASVAIKRWPAERFARLGDILSAEGFTVAIVEGPSEMGIGSRVAKMMSGVPIQVKQLPFNVLAAVIKGMRLLISNDTAVLHLGVSVGTSTLGIFGPTDPIAYTPPIGPHHYIRSNISCSPCNRLE